MIQWWYSTAGKSLGPVDIDGLARLFGTRAVNAQTGVWHEGLAAQNIRLTRQGDFTSINGHESRETSIGFPGKTNVATHLQILVLGYRLWQVATQSPDNPEKAGNRLGHMRQQIWNTVL